ncbi:MAG: hydrolase TatD [Flavobacteriales bacterium]|nr:hydrolase TatD [Flavobacteriales bacterium]
MIDTHSHIYSEAFEGEHEAMIQRAFDLGVEKIYMPNIDLDSVDAMKKIHDMYPDRCLMMMGLHPCSVDANVKEVLPQIKAFLEDGSDYYAVGEIGIDLYWDKTHLAEQEWAFREQIQWAKDRSLPIVIHCRDAFDEILAIMDEVNDDDLKGIFHCFTGGIEQAKHILGYGGFKLGIGGVVTFKNAGLDKVVGQLSMDDLVLETDAPYLAPHPYRGKRNEAAYVKEVALKLADIFGKSVEEVGEISRSNALSIFEPNHKEIESN